MMRTLGTLILLSAAAFAQTPTAVQNPAAPATVSVQPATTHPAPAGKAFSERRKGKWLEFDAKAETGGFGESGEGDE